MNPFDWLRAIYGTFGAKYPTGSLIAVMLLGALFAGALWLIAAHQHESVQSTSNQVPSQNTTHGAQSPIMPDNRGEITITNEQPKPESTPSKE